MTAGSLPAPGAGEAGVPLFARAAFQRVAGDTLRPGGLALTRRAVGLSGLAPGMLALDLGCGRGATARHLAKSGCRVLALDPSARMLREVHESGAGQEEGLAAVQGCAKKLPLRDAVLDAVFCECVLSVTGAAQTVLAEAARALKPGGLLIASDLYLRGATVGRGGHDSCGPGAAGDCRSGAVPEAWLRQCLRESGLRLELFEDHSRLLAELAGRLVFAGMRPAEIWGEGASCSGGGAGARPGYFLCLARKGVV